MRCKLAREKCKEEISKKFIHITLKTIDQQEQMFYNYFCKYMEVKTMRPELTKDLPINDFTDFYWLKTELQQFCRENNMSPSGSKSVRPLCTNTKEGTNRRIYSNKKWEEQKNMIQQLLSPVFGYLKANLRFTRMSVRGKTNVKNELGFAFMAVNLRKCTAMNASSALPMRTNAQKKGSTH
jgi:hypothetical protein